MRLFAVELSGRGDAELVADRCWQAGAAGIWEVDAGMLRVGVEDDGAAAFCDALTDLAPVDVTDAEAVVLAGRWASVTFAGRRIELWVPPTVFGDGQHPTTATCLELLPRAVAGGSAVLDVGCGAGALSIGAALLGARVTAIDIDPDAVDATGANAERNGVAVETSSRQLGEVTERFDTVVANMTSGSLHPLVPDLVRCTRPGGLLLVSGMLPDQWPAVEEAIGGELDDLRTAEGWVTALVTTPSGS